MTEADIQRDIVDYLRLVAPEHLTFAVPNAARRTDRGYASNAVPGLLKGIADLCTISPGGRAYLLEVKSAGGHLRSEQAAMQLRCSQSGIPYAVVRSIDDVREALKLWGVKTREAA